MAVSKALVFVLLFISLFLLLNLVQAETQTNSDAVKASYGYPNPKINCGEACKYRCQKSSRPHLCHRACGTCCSRCKCVPPGTAGNQNMCACYASLTTHGGRKKCP